MEQQIENTETKAPRHYCKNCGGKLSKRGKFCPHCGQRDFDGRVKMGDLLSRFFSNFTHLDSKFVKMCWQLLVPARVTLEYFQGKIKRYPHPVQFFFIVMFFFLLVFSRQFGRANFESTGGNFELKISGEHKEDSVLNHKAEEMLRSKGVFGVLEQYVKVQRYKAAVPSLPAALRTTNLTQALDSLARKVDGPSLDAANLILSIENANTPKDSLAADSLTLNFIVSEVKVSVPDLIDLTPDSIIAKYGIHDWEKKVALRQGIKSLKDPKGLIHRYVGSFGWAILILIAFMALVLRLLYWRRGGYYVEHFIFLMHQQAGAFLLLTLALAFSEFIYNIPVLWLLAVGWIGISLLIAMKRFYGESWPWTIAKWLIYCVLYVIGLIELFIGTLLVVFIVF